MIDNTVTSNEQEGYYLPHIPLRLDNVMVDEDHFDDLYAENKRAYKKLVGPSGKYGKDLIQPLDEHENLKDMDYVYVLPAVTLNTKENAARKYLFEFFKMLEANQDVGSNDYSDWQENQMEYEQYSQEFAEWKAAQEDPLDPLYNTPAPTTKLSQPLPGNEIQIKSNGTTNTNMDIRISWQSITSASHTGLFKPEAKIGDVEVVYGSTDVYAPVASSEGSPIQIDPLKVDRLSLVRQTSLFQWEQINIIGLVHRNYIYGGKFVEITAKEALEDIEESGFLVPIHSQTLSAFSLKDSTQMSMACCYMVINTYQIVKSGFFGSAFFKILMVAVVIAITYATGGFGAQSIGLLGSNAAVGTSLGFTGTAAVIAGAVANAVVAMVLVKVITVGAVAVFGDKLGAIIGTIASLVALQVGTALQSGASLSASFGALLKADNIIAMTSAVGNGVAGYVQAATNEMVSKTRELQEDYRERSEEISRLYAENIGSDRARLDPLGLMSDDRAVNMEGANAFLQRTLMTGSDVAEMSLTMLSNFADITLSTELNY